MDPIAHFQNEYAWLSNFYPAPVKLQGDPGIYPTVEHGYQAAKTLIIAQRTAILACKTPGQAKRMGKLVTIRKDWERVKRTIMLDLVHQKFSNDPQLTDALRATGNARLIEGNSWGDCYWGCVWKGGDWVGQNWLGEILMKVRKEIEIPF